MGQKNYGNIWCKIMKKVFISVTDMELGGISTSLIGLLDSFDYSKYEVTLFLYDHSGEMLDKINPNVHVVKENLKAKASKRSILFAVKKGQLEVAFFRIIGKIYSFMRNYVIRNRNINMGMTFSNWALNKFILKKQQQQYDMAISFATPHYYILMNVDAKIKIGWIHTDYGNKEEQFDVEFEREMWNELDYIVAVSTKCREAFLTIYPELSKKVLVIENIISKRLIYNQAMKKCEDIILTQVKNKYTFLSVGRFSTAKNFDNIPEICSLLIKQGFDIKWFLIGYGGDEELIRSKIIEYGMEEYVIILGKRDNPYPHMKYCDVYIQPSRYEGKCVAVCEAQMLDKPVVITRYKTSSSQLNENIDGFIVPMDNHGCADGIVKLLKSPTLVKKIIDNCREKDFSHSEEIEKLYELLK